MPLVTPAVVSTLNELISSPEAGHEGDATKFCLMHHAIDLDKLWLIMSAVVLAKQFNISFPLVAKHPPREFSKRRYAIGTNMVKLNIKFVTSPTKDEQGKRRPAVKCSSKTTASSHWGQGISSCPRRMSKGNTDRQVFQRSSFKARLAKHKGSRLRLFVIFVFPFSTLLVVRVTKWQEVANFRLYALQTLLERIRTLDPTARPLCLSVSRNLFTPPRVEVLVIVLFFIFFFLLLLGLLTSSLRGGGPAAPLQERRSEYLPNFARRQYQPQPQ